MTLLYLPSLQKEKRNEFPHSFHVFDTSSDMMWTVANVPIDTKSHFFNNLVLTSLFSLVPGLGFSLEEENFVGYFPFFFFGVFETHSWALVAHPRQFSVSSRPSWSIKRVPGQQEVHRETKNKQQILKIERDSCSPN